MIPTVHGQVQPAPAADLPPLTRNGVYSDLFNRLAMAEKAAADSDDIARIQTLLEMRLNAIRLWDQG